MAFEQVEYESASLMLVRLNTVINTIASIAPQQPP